jgi:cytochrome c-type biogenesis protein CcmH/NrfG
MRFRLRTLLIVLAIVPPLSWIGWTKYEAWRAGQVARERQRAAIKLRLALDGTMPPSEALRLPMQNASPEQN